VQFRVSGPDPKVLRLHADEVKAAMRANPNTRGVNDNWNESVKVLRLQVDQDKARALGVTSQSIAQASRVLLTGSVVGQFREGDKLIDIVLRQPQSERQTMADLASAYVPTASGRAIPLLQIAQPAFDWEPGVMWRENRDYAITVQSDIVEGLQGATVTAQLLPELKALEAKWGQPDYRISVAGAVEESSKGSASIAAGVPLMLFVTFTLLMLQLQSFSRSMLVFLTGPLGIAGVAAALLLLGRPFGFVALLGVIALLGMIQRNSVILIDQIEQDRARGVPAWDAIVEAAVRRLRPIVLTAAAAVLAMTGVETEVIDAQTLIPFDTNHLIVKSLEKTNRILFVDEDVPGGATSFMFSEVMDKQGGYRWLDASPRILCSQPHRPGYGSDGDYFSKPNTEDVVAMVMEMMAE
jgi:multidrug efflux pump subunit AcrB